MTTCGSLGLNSTSYPASHNVSIVPNNAQKLWSIVCLDSGINYLSVSFGYDLQYDSAFVIL